MDTGALDALAEYFEGNSMHHAPTSVRSGNRKLPIQVNWHESYNHDPEASEETLDRMCRNLGWWLFNRGDMRSEMRLVSEMENRRPTQGEERPTDK